MNATVIEVTINDELEEATQFFLLSHLIYSIRCFRCDV